MVLVTLFLFQQLDLTLTRTHKREEGRRRGKKRRLWLSLLRYKGQSPAVISVRRQVFTGSSVVHRDYLNCRHWVNPVSVVQSTLRGNDISLKSGRPVRGFWHSTPTIVVSRRINGDQRNGKSQKCQINFHLKTDCVSTCHYPSCPTRRQLTLLSPLLPIDLYEVCSTGRSKLLLQAYLLITSLGPSPRPKYGHSDRTVSILKILKSFQSK